jgi:hypothetical protein
VYQSLARRCRGDVDGLAIASSAPPPRLDASRTSLLVLKELGVGNPIAILVMLVHNLVSVIYGGDGLGNLHVSHHEHNFYPAHASRGV